MTTAFFVGIGVLAMLLLWRLFGWRTTLDGQLVANRQVPQELVGVWMAVAFTFGTTLFFSGQLAYEHGWRGLAFYAIGNIGGLLLGMLVAQKIPNPSGKYTLAQFVGERYGEGAGLLYALCLTGMQAFYALTLQFLAAASLFSLIEGASWSATVLVAAAVMLVPVVAGGLRSSAVIDFIKGAMMVTLIVVLTPFVVSKAGGVASIAGGVPQGGDFATFARGLGAPLLLSLLCGGPLDQSLYQRYFAVNRQSGHSLWPYLLVGAAFFALNIGAGAVLGFLASNRSLGIVVSHANIAGFATMAHYAPWGAAFFGLMTVAAFAASGDTALNASSSVFAVDIYRKRIRPNASEREVKLVQRASMVVFIAVATYIALQKVDMLWLVVAVGAVRSALVVPVLVAAWDTSSRVKGVLCVALVSMLASATLYVWQYKLLGSLVGITLTGAYCLWALYKPQKLTSAV